MLHRFYKKTILKNLAKIQNIYKAIFFASKMEAVGLFAILYDLCDQPLRKICQNMGIYGTEKTGVIEYLSQ